MASALGLARLGRALGVASLLASVSTAALADPDPQPDPRDARIQQLQDEVRQLVADHQRLQAEDDQLVAKAQQLEAEVDALKQGQAAQGAAIQSQSQTIQTVEANAPAAGPQKTDDGSLTWHGVTIYGTYDIGLSWVSHGLPENASNYEGESLVNRNGNHSQFLIAPDNLSQTGLGIRGKEEFLPGWFGVFNASTGFVPQTGQLANLAATNTSNAGLPRKSYSFAGDGARAGQPFNDELYVGLSSRQVRHADRGPSARPGHGCDAAVRPGRRRLCLLVHRLQRPDGRRRGYSGHALGQRPEVSRRLRPDAFRRDVQIRRRSGRLFLGQRGLDRRHLHAGAAAQLGVRVRYRRRLSRLLGRRRDPARQPGDQRPQSAAGAWESVGAVPVDDRQHQREPGQRRQSDRNGQHRIRRRHRQHCGHGGGQVQVEPVQVLRRLRVHPLHQPGQSARRRGHGAGRLSAERRRRQQPGFSKESPGRLDRGEVRVQQQDGLYLLVLLRGSERLPGSGDLLAGRRFPQFLRGPVERSVVLRGLPPLEAVRRLHRRRLLRRFWRPGDRHPPRAWCSLFLRRQHCPVVGGRYAF